jgi:hypothetical protein
MMAASPIQGDLFASTAGASAETLRRFLAESSKCRVDLTFTRNRVSMASLVFVSEVHARVRLHAQFITAPHEVWQALADYLHKRRRRDWGVVAEFARTIDTSSENRPSASSSLRQQGNVYDLAKIGMRVNKQHFNGRIKYQIGWGRNRSESPQRRRQQGRSIRYGSWSRTTRTIRVHPLLDDPRVPLRFVEYIVFHEMLHAVVPSDHVNGQRRDHPKSFRVLEKAYPNLSEMTRLSRELLSVLI